MEVACQAKEVAAEVRHPSLARVAEAVSEPALTRRAVGVVVVEVPFQAREGVVGVRRTLQVAVEEAGEEVEVGTG